LLQTVREWVEPAIKAIDARIALASSSAPQCRARRATLASAAPMAEKAKRGRDGVEAGKDGLHSRGRAATGLSA
jgi:hypothetical protein